MKIIAVNGKIAYMIILAVTLLGLQTIRGAGSCANEIPKTCGTNSEETFLGNEDCGPFVKTKVYNTLDVCFLNQPEGFEECVASEAECSGTVTITYSVPTETCVDSTETETKKIKSAFMSGIGCPSS